MNAFNERRDEDLKKLKQLELATNGRIRVIGCNGSPISHISLRFQVQTAADDRYPAKSLTEVDATIELSARYPFQEPSVVVKTNVFNPNIYTSGRVCLGSKWIATEYLDLLAQRLFKILSFDDSVINVASAANGDAARWYLRAKGASPQSFPSDSLQVSTAGQKSSVSWTDKSEEQVAKVVVTCPHCGANVRLPAGKAGSVVCPKCKNSFSART
ncbi:ubiquitin-conjugating enzyme E2 [Dyella nitratireducens]|uniref:Rieske domain-containing protein n=1 Tax=Dyella nitratireducens TaxID=1849580 RepID=A0ABQ1GVU7_9GAMM|nr:ubiquitin-conjugating enzyme E2 [Dyella nitratireducens]GGA51381.1 hypothetical protein GCM10010981_45970 [Dyella nitratireducens]GLQ41710.1 hypothetical protein GCM10007902_15600 [Dyella nitratireducens]